MLLKTRNLRVFVIGGAIIVACWLVYYLSRPAAKPHRAKWKQVQDNDLFLNLSPKKSDSSSSSKLKNKEILNKSIQDAIEKEKVSVLKSPLGKSQGADDLIDKIREDKKKYVDEFADKLKDVPFGNDAVEKLLNKPTPAQQLTTKFPSSHQSSDERQPIQQNKINVNVKIPTSAKNSSKIPGQDTSNPAALQKEISNPKTSKLDQGAVSSPGLLKNDSKVPLQMNSSKRANGKLSVKLQKPIQQVNTVGNGSRGQTHFYTIIHGDKSSAVSEQIHSNTEFISDDVSIEDFVLSSSSFPTLRLRPSVGNGYLGTLVHAPDMFMSGLYNGKQEQSHRASIPSTVSFNITGTEPPVKLKRTYNLDTARGIYYEESMAETFNITQKIFAHRTLRNIMVVEVDLVRRDVSTPLKILVSILNKWSSSYDITFRTKESDIDEVSYKFGSISSPEKDDSPYGEVHLLYDHVPDHLEAPVNTQRTKWVFLTAVATGRIDAFKAYNEAKRLVHLGDELYFQHVKGWADLWKDGLIRIEGNKDLAQKTYSSWYYLLSSMPLTDDNLRQKFNGLSPCGLPVGDLRQDYQGHVTSDQELWLFPPFLFYHPQLARLLLLSRFNTKRGAMLNAKSSLLPGLQYAYESANTGEEMNVDKTKGKRALYTSAAVALAATKYLRLTNDTALLSQVNFNEVLVGIAKFIHSVMTKTPSSVQYEFQDVIPLDAKLHPKVNNSAFVNALAKAALDAPKEAYARIGQVFDEYTYFAKFVRVPFDEEKKYHPAFDGYTQGTPVQKPDVLLLGYPLGNKPNLNDTTYYAKVTDDKAPPTTWAMLTIAWLSVKDYRTAEKTFSRQFDFVRNDFQVWTESEAAINNTATNYISGAATFLQSVHNGYGGFRVLKDRLNIDPVLPPKVTGISFVGVKYLGSSLDVSLRHDMQLTVMIKKQGPVLLKLIVYKLRALHDLEENKPVAITAAKIAVFSSEIRTLEASLSE